MYLRLNGFELNCAETARWSDAVKMLPEGALNRQPLGIGVRGRSYALDTNVIEYAYANVLTYGDEEGRRIRERSMSILFVTALHRLAPRAHARFEHSMGDGIYIDIFGIDLDTAFVDELRSVMDGIVRDDLPIRAFEMDGGRLWGIDDDCTCRAFGTLAPSTGCLGVFELIPYQKGIVLMNPDRNDETKAARFEDMPNLRGIFRENAEWNRLLECANIADLNAIAGRGGLREFIRVNEALQEHKISRIAEQFVKSGARLITIAGPSSSGKTTFAMRLAVALRVYGLRPVKVSLDDYYLDADTLPLEADGKPDLECVEALDTQLISDHLRRLMDGEQVDLPIFDFTTQKRSEKVHPFRVEKGQPIIIEGIHALNDRLTEGIARKKKFKIYISALTLVNLNDYNRIRTTDARLLRRIVRDKAFRNTSAEKTLSMWESVRRGEDKNIFPFQETADAMFNSALTYELIVLKRRAEPLLRAIGEDSPYYTLAQRQLACFDELMEIDIEDEIPINSLLREFIGGSCFDKG